MDDANGVVDQGDEVAEWLSTFLNRPNLRLVFRDNTCSRVVGTKYRTRYFGKIIYRTFSANLTAIVIIDFSRYTFKTSRLTFLIL